ACWSRTRPRAISPSSSRPPLRWSTRRAGSSAGRRPSPPCPPRYRDRSAASRLSVFDGNDVRLDLAVHSPPPETLGNRRCCAVGCFAETRSAARLDLVPQGGSLAVRDGRHTRGFRPTARRNSRDLG